MDVLEVKARLQNLSNELGVLETYFSYQASKLKPGTGRYELQNILQQSLDRVTAAYSGMWRERSAIRGMLLELDYLKRKKHETAETGKKKL